ncbi:MAG TPA: MerR family transcriptional regulator [Polyangiaceae bacterium LLY-WYZ-14_1]|nr:MerR family transcriptional regulator [Polyangiaceae bacterium LLY-WYZ-14_1]
MTYREADPGESGSTTPRKDAPPTRSPQAAPAGESGSPWTLRMRDLSAATGLPRQAIHFYIREGLVPPGRKTGRNAAVYGPEHLDRLALIRRLQHERFLPLRAIKALLDDRDAADFTESQRRFLREVRTRLPEEDGRGDLMDPSPAEDLEGSPAAPEAGEPTDRSVGSAASGSRTARAAPARADELIQTTGVDPEDLVRLHALGLIRGREASDGALEVPVEDHGVVRIVAELRAAGFTKERGFRVEDLSEFQEIVGRLLRWETALVSRHLGDEPPEVAAHMVERALPLLERLLVRTHQSRLRAFLEAL